MKIKPILKKNVHLAILYVHAKFQVDPYSKSRSKLKNTQNTQICLRPCPDTIQAIRKTRPGNNPGFSFDRGNSDQKILSRPQKFIDPPVRTLFGIYYLIGENPIKTSVRATKTPSDQLSGQFPMRNKEIRTRSIQNIRSKWRPDV